MYNVDTYNKLLVTKEQDTRGEEKNYGNRSYMKVTILFYIWKWGAKIQNRICNREL